MLAKTTQHGYNLAQENHSGFNFKIGISRNAKCDNLVSFSKSGLMLALSIYTSIFSKYQYESSICEYYSVIINTSISLQIHSILILAQMAPHTTVLTCFYTSWRQADVPGFKKLILSIICVLYVCVSAP